MTCSTCSGQMNQTERFCTCCGRPVYQAAYAAQSGEPIFRPRHGRMLAGVCAALALREGWNPVWVRLAAVLLLLVGHGFVLIAYIAAWFIIPNEPLWAMPSAGSGPGVPTAGAAAS